MSEQLQEKLKCLPGKPGVYLMKDDQGQIIYVGKAVILKNRVRSYFTAGKNHSVKVKSMVARIADFEYIVTVSEIEALILECNLIKKYRPKYNITLRDDKNFPYIKVTINEEFPRVFIIRQVLKDGARYFGPFTNAGAVHETLELLKKLFPLRNCRQLDNKRPCLQFHIKKCLAPCAGKINSADYHSMIKAVCLFLEGRSDAVIKDLKRRMEEEAENLNFEAAAVLRNQLAAVEKVIEKQNIVTGSGDQDIIGLARLAADVCVQVFFIRNGKMTGRKHFLISEEQEEDFAVIIASFIKQYYSRATFIPREVVLPGEIEERELLAEWLTGIKRSKVVIEVPKRGTKKDLLNMAANNAAALLYEQEQLTREESDKSLKILTELANFLQLENLPGRIECFDISHTQGMETVASMVVFENGKPLRQGYRRYKLQTVEGKPDDFRSMQEVVARRFRDLNKLPLPDLVIIDGGKGQLSSALQIIREIGLCNLPVVGLAKQFEEIFVEGKSEPVILSRNSQALYLVQRIRDESHRFAITYHRKLRAKRNMVSVLDHVKGIGPKRRKIIWDHFGSLEQIKAAEAAEIAAIPGMTAAAAEAVYHFFRNRNR